MSRVADLRGSQRRTSSLYDTWFTRRVSIYLTALLVPMGVPPNAVTWVNVVVGLAGWVLIGTGVAPLLGVLCIHLYAVLDSVDGEIARHTRSFSLQGMFLEDYSAYLMIAGYWLSMGWVLQRDLDSYIPLVLGLALVAFGRSAMPVARRVMLQALVSERWAGRTGNRVTAGNQPGGAAVSTSSTVTGFRRLGRFLDDSVLHPSHVWAVTTTVYAVHVLWVQDPRPLAGVVAVYYLLSWGKEVVIVVGMGVGNELAHEVRRVERHGRIARGETDEAPDGG